MTKFKKKIHVKVPIVDQSDFTTESTMNQATPDKRPFDELPPITAQISNQAEKETKSLQINQAEINNKSEDKSSESSKSSENESEKEITKISSLTSAESKV